MENKRNREIMFGFRIVFFFLCFFSEKHKKKHKKMLNLKNKEDLSENTFFVFFMFS